MNTSLDEERTHLYLDKETGQPVVTNSMIKTFRRCPKQTQYKYLERLKLRQLTAREQPLQRGTWVHALLEAHYGGIPWRTVHAELTAKFENLFDEEKEALGDLPRECARLMASYLWHYGANKDDPMHGWEVLETEGKVEAELPNGTLFRGKYDLKVRDEYGVWLVDHKTHKVLPDFSFRIKDVQSAMYVWAAEQNGEEIEGFIWNYIRVKPPTVPQVLKDGSRLSSRSVETDYPTLLRAIRDGGLDPKDYATQLRSLKASRWAPGATQTSAFFRREVLDREPGVLTRVAREAFHTVQRMEDYDWDNLDEVERNPERSCTFTCSYRQLCETELLDGNAKHVRSKMYKEGDPMDYYDDKRQEEKE